MTFLAPRQTYLFVQKHEGDKAGHSSGGTQDLGHADGTSRRRTLAREPPRHDAGSHHRRHHHRPTPGSAVFRMPSSPPPFSATISSTPTTEGPINNPPFTHRIPRAHAGGSQEDRWAKEFCKASFCGIMSSSKWQLCCEGHDECCAYLQLEGVGGGGGLRASRGGSFSGLLCLQ
nr:uncharacterized protein LOC113826795 isoform X1 [Penaeus vannamei]